MNKNIIIFFLSLALLFAIGVISVAVIRFNTAQDAPPVSDTPAIVPPNTGSPAPALPDGESQDGTTTPQTITVMSFFSNFRKSQECDAVFPVSRAVPRTPATAEAALRQLLSGPTAEEQQQGYATNIPAGSELRSISLDQGTARVDFNEALNQAAGSCRVTAIRAQITQTLQQFPSVRQVIISVNGRTEDILQP
jgi:spore germination protein GerM